MINDLFVFNSNGIPYIARCYGTKICESDVNHTLLTGFFAALSSFTNEFQDDELRTVEFNRSSLIFTRKSHVMAVVAFSEDEDVQKLRDELCNILDTFLEMFPYTDESDGIFYTSDYDKFNKWLDENFKPNAKMDLRDKIAKKRRSIWSKIRSIFK